MKGETLTIQIMQKSMKKIKIMELWMEIEWIYANIQWIFYYDVVQRVMLVAVSYTRYKEKKNKEHVHKKRAECWSCFGYYSIDVWGVWQCVIVFVCPFVFGYVVNQYPCTNVASFSCWRCFGWY